MSNLTTRVLSAIAYAFFIFLGTHFIGYEWIEKIFPDLDYRYIYLVFICTIYTLCAYELSSIMKFESWWFRIISIIAGAIPLYYFGVQLLNIGANLNFNFRKILYVVPFVVALVTIFKYSEELDNIDSSKIIFFVCYLGMPFGLALLLQNFGSMYPSEVFYIFVLIWANDSFAYLVGSRIGKRKLAPSISPNKSWEGFFGGVIGTIVVGIVLQNTVGYLNGNWIIIALIVSIFAPLGDLAESKIKRTFDVKDSSHLIPGHGGFLDRLDSFIGVAPFIYLYLIISNI